MDRLRTQSLNYLLENFPFENFRHVFSLAALSEQSFMKLLEELPVVEKHDCSLRRHIKIEVWSLEYILQLSTTEKIHVCTHRRHDEDCNLNIEEVKSDLPLGEKTDAAANLPSCRDSRLQLALQQKNDYIPSNITF